MGVMPIHISEVFAELKTEITWLHGRWTIYRQLFDESEKRVSLLNECAPVFFYIVQDIFLGEIQVSLSKLTDPDHTGNRENLSLEQLQKRIENLGEQQLAADLRTFLDNLHNKCQPFRKWRNKRLAHLDLSTAMQSRFNPLPGISIQMIEETLYLVREYMNRIEEHYCDDDTPYEDLLISDADEALLTTIKAGLRYEELLQSGEISLDDWHRGKWSSA